MGIGLRPGMIFVWTLYSDFGFGHLDFSGFGLPVQAHELGSVFLIFWTFGLLLRTPVPIVWTWIQSPNSQSKSKFIWTCPKTFWDSNLDPADPGKPESGSELLVSRCVAIPWGNFACHKYK